VLFSAKKLHVRLPIPSGAARPSRELERRCGDARDDLPLASSEEDALCRSMFDARRPTGCLRRAQAVGAGVVFWPGKSAQRQWLMSEESGVLRRIDLKERGAPLLLLLFHRQELVQDAGLACAAAAAQSCSLER